MNHYDHYSEAKRLANILRQEDLNEGAKKIEDAMSEGSTGTEIFMMLRMQISQFLSSKQGSIDAIACASHLLNELNASLG